MVWVQLCCLRIACYLCSHNRKGNALPYVSSYRYIYFFSLFLLRLSLSFFLFFSFFFFTSLRNFERLDPIQVRVNFFYTLPQFYCQEIFFRLCYSGSSHTSSHCIHFTMNRKFPFFPFYLRNELRRRRRRTTAANCSPFSLFSTGVLLLYYISEQMTFI